VVGGGVGVGGEPFVEGDGEAEEFVSVADGVDHFDVDLGVGEGGLFEVLDVVEEVAGEGGVGLDGGGGEAELVVVLHDFLVDGVVDGDGDDGDLGAFGGLDGEEAAVDVVLGCGGDLVVVGGDELDAGVGEGDGVVGVVGDDDADGQQAVLDVGQAEEGAELGVVAGVGRDGDVLVGVGVEGGVLAGGLGGLGAFLVRGVGGGGGQDEDDDGSEREAERMAAAVVASRLRCVGCAGGGGAWGRRSAVRAHAGKIILFS